MGNWNDSHDYIQTEAEQRTAAQRALMERDFNRLMIGSVVFMALTALGIKFVHVYSIQMITRISFLVSIIWIPTLIMIAWPLLTAERK